MKPNNKPNNFNKQNCTTDQAGQKTCSPSNQPNNALNDRLQQNGGFKKSDVNSTEKIEKTNGQPNKFNNFKK